MVQKDGNAGKEPATHQIPGVQRGHVAADRKRDAVTAVNAPIENGHDKAPLFFREPVGQKTGRQRIASRLSTAVSSG